MRRQRAGDGAPGTLLQLRTSEPLGSKRAQDGQPVQFTLISDVTHGRRAGNSARRYGPRRCDRSEEGGPGDLGGSSALALTLTSLDLGGQSYPLTTDQFKVKGPNKAGQTVGSAVTGGLIGTIIGCAAGRGVGCAIGAGAGVAAGTAASAASSGPGVWIPAEALVTFHLAAPLTVNPVSQQEAARLAQGLYQGGPRSTGAPATPTRIGPATTPAMAIRTGIRLSITGRITWWAGTTTGGRVCRLRRGISIEIQFGATAWRMPV